MLSEVPRTGTSVGAEWAKSAPAVLLAHRGPGSGSSGYTSIQVPVNGSGTAAEDGPSVWALATGAGDLAEACGSRLQPVSVLVVVVPRERTGK